MLLAYLLYCVLALFNESSNIDFKFSFKLSSLIMFTISAEWDRLSKISCLTNSKLLLLLINCILFCNWVSKLLHTNSIATLFSEPLGIITSASLLCGLMYSSNDGFTNLLYLSIIPVRFLPLSLTSL